MSAYWLTFKPFGPATPSGMPMEDLRELVRRFEFDPSTATEWWRIAAHRSARIGDRVYLFKQGDDPRGIFGIGTIISGPELRDSSSGHEGQQHQALIRFERLIDPTMGFLLPLEEVNSFVPTSLIKARASGITVPEKIVLELERGLAPSVSPITSCQADDLSFDPDSATDERQRAIRAIRIRRGQGDFRSALLDVYGGRCVITGCAIADVLEAAHITPYLGPLTNHISNGLLLRADIHTLLDCGLIAIHPGTRRVVIAEGLKDSAYAKISGRRLRLPINEVANPSRKALEKQFAEFESQQKQRA